MGVNLFCPGFQTALSLAMSGAHVILACRSPVKADEAIAKIRQKKVGGGRTVKTVGGLS